MTAPTETGDATPGSVARRRVTRGAQVLVSFVVVAALFGFAIPKMAGVGYGEVVRELRTLSPAVLLLLMAVWLLRLWVYAFTLQLCLPGLRHAQAMVLNVAGTSVSNVVPFGGAAGVGATYAIAMSWGQRARRSAPGSSPADYSTST